MKSLRTKIAIVLISMLVAGVAFAASHAWQCKKCGTTIQAASQPNSSGCPKGSNHTWHRLN